MVPARTVSLTLSLFRREGDPRGRDEPHGGQVAEQHVVAGATLDDVAAAERDAVVQLPVDDVLVLVAVEQVGSVRRRVGRVRHRHLRNGDARAGRGTGDPAVVAEDRVVARLRGPRRHRPARPAAETSRRGTTRPWSRAPSVPSGRPSAGRGTADHVVRAASGAEHVGSVAALDVVARGAGGDNVVAALTEHPVRRRQPLSTVPPPSRSSPSLVPAAAQPRSGTSPSRTTCRPWSTRARWRCRPGSGPRRQPCRRRVIAVDHVAAVLDRRR